MRASVPFTLLNDNSVASYPEDNAGLPSRFIND
jgi:hypothetical protein